MTKMQEELTELREFVWLCKPIIERLNIDTDIQKYTSEPRFDLHMDRSVQPLKLTPAFTLAVASSSKAIGQTSNVVNHAAHTDLSSTCQHIESNRGNQNLSKPSVRAYWASQKSHTNDGDVGLIDEDFDTDPGDPFIIVEW